MLKEPVSITEAQARVPFRVRETAWLRSTERVARFVLRGDAEARLAAGAAFGAPLPAICGRAATHDARVALALGPDEHLLLVPERDATTFPAELGRALAGLPHSLVDVSHRQVAFELRGPHAQWLLAAACPLPLELDVFPIGACTRTVFGKAEIVLWRTGLTAFRIEVARSYCCYVVDLLGEVARELPPAETGGVS
jgi:sarcosine oxidase subunit gamma